MSSGLEAAAEIEALRQELQSLRDEAGRLAAELARAQRQSAQAQALAAEEPHEAIRMEHLERVLDLSAVTRHVREAIARAPRVEGSGQPVVIDDLLPAAVRQAAVEAIPPPAFLDDDAGGSPEVSLPPKVAPTYVVATWMFLNDVAKDLIGPALVVRAAEPQAQAPGLELKLTRSLLLRARPVEPRRDRPAPDEVLTLVAHLGDYDWHVGFKSSGRPAVTRRRHGDISSWSPVDGGGRL